MSKKAGYPEPFLIKKNIGPGDAKNGFGATAQISCSSMDFTSLWPAHGGSEYDVPHACYEIGNLFKAFVYIEIDFFFFALLFFFTSSQIILSYHLI